MVTSENRVSVAEAAEELGLGVATVRFWMEIGQLPIGRVVKRKGAKRATYIIYRDKLNEELGKNGNIT